MSLFNNNQVLHVAAECAVLAAITFYISIKYKQLQAKLESLNNRIEEQAEIIQKHGVMIENVHKLLNQKSSRNTPKNKEIPRPYGRMGVSKEKVNIKKSSPKVELPPRNEPKIEEVSVEEELEEELKELNLKTEKKEEKTEEKKDEKTV